jgi:hypothetical protein
MQGPINLGHVMKAHARFKREHHNLFGREIESAGRFGLTHVQQHPLFKPRTRNLQRATQYSVMKLKSGAVLRFRTRLKYAKVIDQGSPRHMIAARRTRGRRPVLAFKWKGVQMFRRYVMHPGTKPYRFLYRAANAAGRVFVTSMDSGMNRIAKSF